MSITINGASYALTYVDCPSDFWELPGASLTVDPWGLDVLRRKFQGRMDKCEGELAKYKRRRDKRDEVYKNLFAVDWQLEEGAPFATLVVTYRGIKDGREPEPVIEPGSRTHTVTLDYLGNTLGTTTGVTATFTYRAPTTVVRYATKKLPDSPRYLSKFYAPRDAIQIQSRSGSPGNLALFRGRSVRGTALSRRLNVSLDGNLNAYNGVLEIMSEIKPEQVGQWWAVEESFEARIVPLELVNRGFTEQL